VGLFEQVDQVGRDQFCHVLPNRARGGGIPLA
ncbi:MAG: hypothetical protein JWN80_1061, partial [Microbacteriaceae bacterium]|nr:hypothetical protein [Microbacteriaceae bacterium]